MGPPGAMRPYKQMRAQKKKVHTYVYICICMYMYIYIYIYIERDILDIYYIYIYVCECVCIYIYIHMYIIYIYIYIYICIHIIIIMIIVIIIIIEVVLYYCIIMHSSLYSRRAPTRGQFPESGEQQFPYVSPYSVFSAHMLSYFDTCCHMFATFCPHFPVKVQ